MKKTLFCCLVLVFGSAGLSAQNANEIDQLKKQLQQLQESFDRLQKEHQQQIETLNRKLEDLTKQQSTDAARKKLEQELAAELQTGTSNAPAAAVPAPSPSTWSADQPITVARAGSSYLNLSFDALMDVGGSSASHPADQLELGDHDPNKRGFTLPNAEIVLDGAVDPYFKGFANIVLKLDQNNETSVELEETYLQSSSLPGNLQLKAGQFFAAFGRQNSQHPHQWAFVDSPIILTRTFGPDGLRNLGSQLSWLAPTPFFTEVTLGVFDGQGGTAFSFRNPGDDDGTGVDRFHGRSTFDRHLRGPGDLVFVPRISSSFDLSDTQTLVAGLSGAFGPNDTGGDRNTRIFGGDLYWKWKPTNAHAGFPFVSWQTEALYQQFEAGADVAAGLPSETLDDWGGYTQVLWGFKERWIAGLRGEYADGNHGAFDASDRFRGERYRVSPAITFYPSEFSKFRLQYNFDHGQQFGDDHSIWLQMEFLLGAHGAHKF